MDVLGIFQFQADTAVGSVLSKSGVLGRMRVGISAVLLVQTTVSSAIDWYNVQFDGELMKTFLAYYGYDFDVIAPLTTSDREPYKEKAKELGMTTYDIVDCGDYIMVCLGRLD